VPAWLKSLTIFITGLLLGGSAVGFGLHAYMKHRVTQSGNADHILDRLSTQLNLSEAQKSRVSALLKVEAPKMADLRTDMEKKSHALWMAFDADLRPLLEEDQRKKLDEMEIQWRSQKGWRVGLGGATYKEGGLGSDPK
jgi:hypothetical protein